MQNLSILKIRDEFSFHWGEKTYLMGVLNVTPDSFSDGGEFNTTEAAVKQAQTLVNAGADIIDIGGQSTRPGAEQISLEEELKRVVPIVEALRKKTSVPISVDTTSAKVAQASVEAGADIVNDISGGTFDSQMLPTVAKIDVPIVLMHIRGNPQTMQQMTNYEDLLEEIISFLQQQINKAIANGISEEKIIIDPGIGFAKTHQQNIEIIRNLQQLQQFHCPILVGPSRKSFIGKILNQPDPKARVWGTTAACCAAISQGADILRIHDIKEIHDVSLVADAIYRETSRKSLLI